MNLFELFVKIGVDDQASKKIASISSKLGSGLKSAAKVAGAAVAAASTAVVAFGASAVKTGAEFDTAMSQVAATMGKTVDEVQELRDFAQQMGSTTVFSATQSAEALNYMALAGYDAEQAMSALPTVLNLAAAGSIDLAYASDMVTDAQSALGLSMEESSIMVDQMAKTASKSNTSVAQLGEAILTVGGTASYMAGGTEQVNKVLGVLADNGIKGAEAGTHLRNMLLSLSAPTDNAQAVIDKFGLQIFDADGKMRDFADIFPELNAAMDGLTDQEKLDAFSQLFNTRDIASATALLNTSVDRWEELGDAIVDSKGAAEAMAATQLDNLNGDITLFKSALEGAQITISDQLTPTLREFVQFGSKGLSELTEGFKEGGLSGAMDAFGSLLGEGLTKIAESLPSVVNAGVSLLQALITGISENGDLIITAAIDAVMVLADGILNMLPKIVQLGLDLIVSLANGIAESLPELIPTIIDVVLQIVDTLTNPETLSNLLTAALDIVLALVEGLLNPETMSKLFDGIFSLVDNLIEFLLDEENLSKIITSAIQLVIAIGEGLYRARFELMKAAVKLVVSLVEAIFETDWIQIGKDVVAGFKDGIKNAWANLKTWFKNLFDDLIGIAKKILGIASPSKVFKKIGGFTAEGFGAGFEDEFAHVKDDMEDALNFDDASVGINASIRKVGAGAASGAFGGISFGDIIINVNGDRYHDENALAEALALKLQGMTDRRAAVFANG